MLTVLNARAFGKSVLLAGVLLSLCSCIDCEGHNRGVARLTGESDRCWCYVAHGCTKNSYMRSL